MKRHAQALVERLIPERGLGNESLVVEIASNDGYLLQYLVAAGVPVLGIEPARNIAKVAVEKGIATVSEFFGRELAARLVTEGRRADAERELAALRKAYPDWAAENVKEQDLR